MPDKLIDLRSDTVTQPTSAMRAAMMEAPLGDDVWGDDPTVNALQERCASMFGKEDACFVPTGTMANQVAIRAQTQPGDEILIHGESHIVRYEGGGAAALSGCSFAIANGERGFFTSEDVRDQMIFILEQAVYCHLKTRITVEAVPFGRWSSFKMFAKPRARLDYEHILMVLEFGTP